jgi:xylulokinase
VLTRGRRSPMEAGDAAHQLRRVFLGIDCGTQSTKALILDGDSSAQTLRVGSSAHDLIERPDGTREQHPDWWVRALIDAVGQAVEAAGPAEVAGIGVSGQQHGLVCLDAKDRPTRAAKLWNDTTTEHDCNVLTERLGGMQAVLDLTGNAFLPGYTAPKISWLRRMEPETYRSTTRMCLPHDFLNHWLTGEFVTEPGDASGTAYFDVRSRRYRPEVLNALDPDRNWTTALPAVVESLSAIGGLTPAAAGALKLAAGIPVSAGGGDNMCAALGTGATRAGPVIVSLGTSGTAFSYSPTPALDPKGEAAAFCDSSNAWLPLACTLNAGDAADWIRDLFEISHEELDAVLNRAKPGARGLSFLPYLNGERTPSYPGGSGVFAGLRHWHSRDDLVRAVIEGVTFGLDYALAALRRSGIEPTEVRLVGGGARSDAWGQLCADIFGIPVMRPVVTESAALGAALQARRVVDGTDFPSDVDSTRTWEPKPDEELAAAASRIDHLRETAIAGRL